MKKTLTLFMTLVAATVAASAQDAQKAAAEAAAALTAAQDVAVAAPKPMYWNFTLQNNINFGQTWLKNWAAGGYNNYSLGAGIDANANYAKGKMLWNNRLQLDYGFLYSDDKPIFQKNKDRIYFESKWGYETPVKHLSYSANFDFRTQFGDNYNYKAPSDAQFAAHPDNPSAAWREAAKDNLKSGLFSPAYINLGFGLLWTPKPWFSVNFAPVTGGVVIVSNESLRNTYGMSLRSEGLDESVGANYKSIRYEFGAQLKADAKWVVNDNFTYTTQVALFYNYLTPKVEPRVNWDNKMFWKLAKYFAFTISTNLIYDPLVKVRDTDNDDVADAKGIQFREFLEFGFTYTIAAKR